MNNKIPEANLIKMFGFFKYTKSKKCFDLRWLVKMIDEQWKDCTGANLIKMIVFTCLKKGRKKVIVKIDYNDIRSIVIRIHVYFVIWLQFFIIIISLK